MLFAWMCWVASASIRIVPLPAAVTELSWIVAKIALSTTFSAIATPTETPITPTESETHLRRLAHRKHRVLRRSHRRRLLER